ncbi:hypothetical protein C2845_PM17G10730 [Panicum miliaceum]|uniref:Uncharacterized protein n=1 Tax=Panicum miliaceum TaxID=4540 RepID=A0A3L6Q4G3_PANMI|nr:hypothetical protein C2845_PM17G10730 [Panicum miliaceum]
MASSSARGPWPWAPPVVGASASTKNSDLQAWGSDSHPPDGFVDLLKKNTPSPAQVVSNGSSSQPINVGDDTNDGDGARTEKRLHA